MAVSTEYRAFIQDQLSGLGPITIRNMFGGAGVYARGVMFALIADETLYFKADQTARPDFEAEGARPFTYEGRHGPITMSYWRVPERLFEDREAMTQWAEQAFSAACRAAAVREEKPDRRKRPRPKLPSPP